MTELAASPLTFETIADTLRRGLESHLLRRRQDAKRTGAIWMRVCRTLARLAALLASFRAGRLPEPKPPRCDTDSRRSVSIAAASEPVAASAQATWRQGRFWLLRLTGQEGALGGLLLARLVDEADVRDLLAASPQARRLLRPLWLALCADKLPPILQRPPRPQPPRPQSPRPESPRPQSPRPQSPRRTRSSTTPLSFCTGARLDRRLAELLGGPPGKPIMLREPKETAVKRN